MAEDPTFSGFSSGDSAQTFAKVIAQIKSDMAAIERSAKNIESSLSKASRSRLGGGGASFGADNAGGNTGSAKPTMSSSLGQISSQLGGAKGIGYTSAFGAGALMGGIGGGGAIAGGLAFAGLPDLVMRPERALNMENAKFGMAQGTGDFGTFQNMLGTAKNRFNVQNEQAFLNTMVYGVQRQGLVGRLGGDEKRAGAQIGGYSTMAALAGIDQSAVTGIMQSMGSAQTYYSSMASGVQTRNPVTGEPIGIEGQTNQYWARAGVAGMSEKDALNQIGINFGQGSTGYQEILNNVQGDTNAADTIVQGLRLRAQQGGKPLKEGQVQDQAKEAGVLGTEHTQGNEGARAVESAKTGMGAEYLLDATAGIEEATKHIENAVNLLTELEGPLRTMVGAYTTMANQMDTFKTELPRATSGITDFFSGLPGFLMGLLMGGKGGLLKTGGSLLLRGGAALAGTAAAPVIGAGVAAGAAVAGVGLAGSWAVHKFTNYDENRKDGSQANEAIARNAGTNQRASGYGSYAKGDWFVESDQDARIHYGEMILPNRVAEGVRKELSLGKTSGNRATETKSDTTVNIYLTVQKASDQEAMQFATKVKKIIDGDRELMSIGMGRFASGYSG